MRPLGWLRRDSGEWRASYVWKWDGEGWRPWDEEPVVDLEGGGVGTAVPVALPELEIAPLDGMLHVSVELTEPMAIPMDSVEGDVILSVYAGAGISPGAVLRVTGDNGCEWRHWHPTFLSLRADTGYDILLERGLWGPDPPTASVNSADVWVMARSTV